MELTPPIPQIILTKDEATFKSEERKELVSYPHIFLFNVLCVVMIVVNIVHKLGTIVSSVR